MSSVYAGVGHVVTVSTNVRHSCEHCEFRIGPSEHNDGLKDSVNHYITKHGYRLLHVGTQTDRDDEGNPWHLTVAVLGN